VKDETALNLAKDELAAVRYAAREQEAAQGAEAELAEVMAASELGQWRDAALRAEERQGLLEAELSELRPAWEEELIHVERLAQAAVSRSSELASAYSEFRDRGGQEGTVLHADKQRRERLDRLEQELQALLPLKVQLPKLQAELAESNGRGRVLRAELDDARSSLQDALDSEAATSRAWAKEEPRLRRELYAAQSELEDAKSEQAMLQAKMKQQRLQHQEVQRQLRDEVDVLTQRCLVAPPAPSGIREAAPAAPAVPQEPLTLVEEVITDGLVHSVPVGTQESEAPPAEKSPGSFSQGVIPQPAAPEFAEEAAAAWPDASGQSGGEWPQQEAATSGWPEASEPTDAWPASQDMSWPQAEAADSGWGGMAGSTGFGEPADASSLQPWDGSGAQGVDAYMPFADAGEAEPLDSGSLDVSVKLEEPSGGEAAISTFEDPVARATAADGAMEGSSTQDIMASFMPFSGNDADEPEGAGLADFMPWANSSPPSGSPLAGPSMIPPPPPAELEPSGLTRQNSPTGVPVSDALSAYQAVEEDLLPPDLEFTATDWEALSVPPDTPLQRPEPKLETPPLPAASPTGSSGVEDKWWEEPSDRQLAAETAARMVAAVAAEEMQDPSTGRNSPSVESLSSTRSPVMPLATADYTAFASDQGDLPLPGARGGPRGPPRRTSTAPVLESPTSAFWSEAFNGPRPLPGGTQSVSGAGHFQFKTAPADPTFRRRSSTPVVFSSGNPFAAPNPSGDTFGFSKGNPFAK